MSDEVAEQHLAMKRFLTKHLYSHEKKLQTEREAQNMLRKLFESYMNDATAMPRKFAEQAENASEEGRARVVADYIAGMTDRYAMAEYEKLEAE